MEDLLKELRALTPLALAQLLQKLNKAIDEEYGTSDTTCLCNLTDKPISEKNAYDMVMNARHNFNDMKWARGDTKRFYIVVKDEKYDGFGWDYAPEDVIRFEIINRWDGNDIILSKTLTGADIDENGELSFSFSSEETMQFLPDVYWYRVVMEKTETYLANAQGETKEQVFKYYFVPSAYLKMYQPITHIPGMADPHYDEIFGENSVYRNEAVYDPRTLLPKRY